VPSILKPDLGKIVWLALGLFVAPKVISAVKSRMG
jgi:hypothetical protein